MAAQFRLRVLPELATHLKGLRELAQVDDSTLFRRLLLEQTLVPRANLVLWQRLARDQANLTQLREHFLAAEARGQLAGDEQARLLDELDQAEAQLQVLRDRLIAFERAERC